MIKQNANNKEYWRKVYKAAALQGILPNPEFSGDYKKFAEYAGKYADAMLVEDAKHDKAAQ